MVRRIRRQYRRKRYRRSSYRKRRQRGAGVGSLLVRGAKLLGKSAAKYAPKFTKLAGKYGSKAARMGLKYGFKTGMEIGTQAAINKLNKLQLE